MLIVMNAGEESRSLDLATMPIKDAAECERLTGWSWVEWREALASDKSAAVGFAWWLAGRRAGIEQGRFSDLDLDLAKLRWSVELDEDEQALMETDGSEESVEADETLPTGPVEVETLNDLI
jgi:hypothetical protein